MFKRQMLLALIAGLVSVGIVVAWSTHEREPRYGGKRLGEWVEKTSWDRPEEWSGPWLSLQRVTYRVANDEAAIGIREIGTTAVPYLLDWIIYEPPPWKTKAIAVLNRVLHSTLKDHAALRADGVARALIVLGEDAGTAVPALARLMNDMQHTNVAQRATEALMALGARRLNADLALLTNNSSWCRGWAAFTISEWENRPSSALPALVRLLKDPNRNVREAARNALRNINPDALERKVP